MEKRREHKRHLELLLGCFLVCMLLTCMYSLCEYSLSYTHDLCTVLNLKLSKNLHKIEEKKDRELLNKYLKAMSSFAFSKKLPQLFVTTQSVTTSSTLHTFPRFSSVKLSKTGSPSFRPFFNLYLL